MNIRGDLMILNHREAVQFFNQLLLDLRKQLLGLEFEPITAERLKEGNRHIQELMECERPAVIRY